MWFSPDVEKISFFYYDGKIFTYTSNQTEKICGCLEKWINEQKEVGYKPNYCFLVIHNHPHHYGFSETDLKTLERLRRYGFERASFCVYAHDCDAVYEWVEKQDED